MGRDPAKRMVQLGEARRSRGSGLQGTHYRRAPIRATQSHPFTQDIRSQYRESCLVVSIYEDTGSYAWRALRNFCR